MNAERLRAELLAALAAAAEPITTTEARIAVSRTLAAELVRPPVTEEVYRCLLVLQRHGRVRRVVDEPSRRCAKWELATLFSEIPLPTQVRDCGLQR